jgi:hypothetical protein
MVLDVFYAKCVYVLKTITKVPYFSKLCDNSTI